MSSLENKQIVADIINFFYPDSDINAHYVTNDMGDLAAEMLEEALEATSSMHLVPRPTYTPSFNWLMKEGVKTFWRMRGKDEIYESVRVTVALRFKSAFELEKLGV